MAKTRRRMSSSPASTRSNDMSTKPTSPESDDVKESSPVAIEEQKDQLQQQDKPAVSRDDEEYKDESDVEIVEDNKSRSAAVGLVLLDLQRVDFCDLF